MRLCTSSTPSGLQIYCGTTPAEPTSVYLSICQHFVTFKEHIFEPDAPFHPAAFPNCLRSLFHTTVSPLHRCPAGHMTKESSLGKVCVYTLCASRPCRHGTCVAHSPSRYSCRCSEGYRGRHCEVTLAMYHEADSTSLSLSSMFAISICVMAFLGSYVDYVLFYLWWPNTFLFLWVVFMFGVCCCLPFSVLFIFNTSIFSLFLLIFIV